MPEPVKQFMVEDAELIYRNFSGTVNQYNKNGERDFAVILDEKTANLMANDGWAVKFPKPEDEESGRRPFIKVKVGYKIRPPKVIAITSKARTSLTQDTIEMLDWADIQQVDLIAVASNWEVGGKSGIAAYLKTMFVIVNEDELELKYALDPAELRNDG